MAEDTIAKGDRLIPQPQLLANHLIWVTGLLGHMLLLAVLFKQYRAQRFPCFTLLIFFNVVRSLALATVLPHLRPAALNPAIVIFEIGDLLLEFAVLIELMLTALAPLAAFRRVSLLLLVFASGAVFVTKLAPVHRYTGSAAPILLHFYLGVLFFEWALVLLFLLRQLALRWRADVAAISLGFGLYSAVLLFAGGYFRTGREIGDYVFFSYLRIGVYLFVLLWWIVALWNADTAGNPRKAAAAS